MSHNQTAKPTNLNVHRTVTFDHTPTSSRTSSVARASQPSPRSGTFGARTATPTHDDSSDWDSEDEMGDRRPALHRPTDGRSGQPLLSKDDEDRGRTGYNAGDDPEDLQVRPTFSRRSTMRSRSPDTMAKLATKKKYTYAAFFLGLSLISFVIQTETAVYIQHELHWDKAYCML
jgi:hypothetical protein